MNSRIRDREGINAGPEWPPERLLEDLDAVRVEFEQTSAWNAKFWHRMRRLGHDPDLTGTICMDLGSGLGSLSHDIARRDADRVVGIDTSDDRVRLARQLLGEYAGDVSDRVDFIVGTPTEHYAENTFDFVFSRDTFEHVMDLPAVLRELETVLKPDGKIFTGFGPLYNSPFGDHGLLAGWPRVSGGPVGVPWGHLLFGDLKGNWLTRLRPRATESVRRQLNALPFSAYENAFADSGMEIEAFHVNVSDNPAMKVLSTLRRFPALREYCTVNICAVLRKPSETAQK